MGLITLHTGGVMRYPRKKKIPTYIKAILAFLYGPVVVGIGGWGVVLVATAKTNHQAGLAVGMVIVAVIGCMVAWWVALETAE